MGALDHVRLAWPSAKLAVVVDDIQLLAKGRTPCSAVGVVNGAARCLVSRLEGEAGLVVSWPKLQVLTSSSEAAREVASLTLLAAGLAKSARNLGVDFSSGQPRGETKVRQARIAKARRRVPFFRRLRTVGPKRSGWPRWPCPPPYSMG